jgi:hypothetical protein
MRPVILGLVVIAMSLTLRRPYLAILQAVAGLVLVISGIVRILITKDK